MLKYYYDNMNVAPYFIKDKRINKNKYMRKCRKVIGLIICLFYVRLNVSLCINSTLIKLFLSYKSSNVNHYALQLRKYS